MADSIFEALVGRVVAGYRVERKLGQGGMGAVFQATQVELERPGAPCGRSASRRIASRRRWRSTSRSQGS